MSIPEASNKTPPRAASREEYTAKYQPQAKVIQEVSGAAVLATCAGKVVENAFDSNAFNVYRANVLEAAGQPTDPIEMMIIEQLLWAHHRIGILQTEAVCAKTVEAAILYNTAAARLMAEFRKSSLALREYRTPVVQKNITVVKQQNVAAGDQQIAYLDGNSAVPSGVGKNRDTELVSNSLEAITHEHQTTLIPQPQTSRGRAAEPCHAWAIDAGRARAAEGSGPCKPTMETIYRPEDGGGENPLGDKRAISTEGE